MPHERPDDDGGPPAVHDLVGVGFGPSNLALAVALHEAAGRGEHDVSARFLERQAAFGWHRGMLLDGASMQVSFLKDLVTMRDPTSPSSFVAYLHERGRLADFINHKQLFPSRVEFHDYLGWVAERHDALVDYGTSVRAVLPVERDGVLEALDVVADGPDGELVHRTRGLVVGAGLRGRLPEGVAPSDRVWHNQHLLAHLAEREASGAPEPRRVTVVGAGQSAAETVAHLHDRFPRAEVCAVFARWGFSPADDSKFVNRIFDPDAVDAFHVAPEHVKRRLVDYHRLTNYSAVDVELIDELYRRVYEESVRGEERLRVLHATEVATLEDRPGEPRVGLEVDFLPTGERTRIDSDLLIFATGYEPIDPDDLLDGIAGRCVREEDGRLRVHRDYRVALDGEARAAVWLHGATEPSHGLASTLLSNTAVRAGELLASVTAHAARVRPAAALAGGA